MALIPDGGAMVSYASVLQSKKKKKKERNLDFISQLYLNKTKEKIKKEFLILLISHTIITKYFYK